MRAKEIMTKQLVTAKPETSVTEIAQMMMEHRISAVPVITPDQRLLGIISETDLLQRREAGMERLPRSWWLALFNSKDRLTKSVDKTEGNLAKNIMTTPAISVDQEATIEDVARLFLTRKINQAPVVHRGKLVGIVSRGDLVSAVARSD
ncbi:MAG: CBS domain-containing protein [Rhodospirillaceae bacterium]|nr:CBS domain-containing protein [Rhodospirillaceae bacterium]